MRRRSRVCLVALALALGIGCSQPFEVPTLVDTDYPIPPGAIFVASDGDDANPGTEAAPLRHIATAAQNASPGSTIVIREGVYRESIGTYTKTLTLQPYPHEEVWVKGSVIVSSWVPESSRWKHSGWTAEFDDDSYDAGAFQPEHPHAGKPDMVFIDGRPQRQVGSLGEVVPGSFYVDDGDDALYIGTDPTGRSVEAAAHERALRFISSSADGSIVRGLGFLHYAGTRFAGALQCDDAHVTFENNTIAWGASKGMAVYNTGAVIRGNTFLYNGQMGLVSWRSDGLIIEGNRFARNNQENFVLHGAVAEASGSKLTETSQLEIRDNLFEKNRATGLWMDISVHDATVVRNTARDNHSFGIFFELSANSMIAGNLLVRNDDGGIAISNSSNVRVVNNTIVDSTEEAIRVFDDSRVNGDSEEIALGITWITSDVEVENNLISNGGAQSDALLFVRDFNSSPLKSAEEMLRSLDFNGWYRSDSAMPASLVEWWQGVVRVDFADLAAFQAATGFETNGLGLDDVTPNPLFVQPALGNYQLQPGSPAVGAGTGVDADIAAELGIAPGTPADLGAFPYAFD